MQGSDTRILTTHTGSLPRPQALTELHARKARGEAVDDAELKAAGRAAVAWVVERQREAGIDIGSDGEQQRESFALYLRHRLSGLGGAWERDTQEDVDRYPEFKKAWRAHYAGRTMVTLRHQLPKAVGPVRYLDRAAIETECGDFADAVATRSARFIETFMAAPSPGIVASVIRDEHYGDQQAYLSALGAALKVEYEAIVESGCVLQLDCPDLALERHLTYRGKPIGEFLAFVERVVAAINTAIASLPPDRVRLHVCWGNYEAPHDSDVPLADILPLLFKAKVGAFVLPFANPRHAHEYRLFETMRLAPGQILVAGVIDTLTNFVEHPEVVADRIERIAGAVGDPRRVIAGTDCGFDTSAGAGRVASDVVWAKLKALSEGARIASGRLFG